MIAGVVMSVVAGALIARPPFSMLGAILLVLATITFAVGASWTVRKTWDAKSWPELGVPARANGKLIRKHLIVQCISAPGLIGIGVWQALTGGMGWVSIVFGTLFLIQAVNGLQQYGKGAHLRSPTRPDNNA
jgi:hypothetical protein